MPSVTVTRTVKAVDLMVAPDPGDLLIDTLRTLGSEGASKARAEGASAEAQLRPSLNLQLTLYWE